MTDEINNAAELSKESEVAKSISDKAVVTGVNKEDTADDVSDLKGSDFKWRAKYKLTKQELEDQKAQAEKEKAELSSKITNTLNVKKTMEEKLLHSKLENAAITAGIKDLDLIKLVDTSKIKINADGDLQGVAEAIQEFKAKKPDFFGNEKKTSSSTNNPVTGMTEAPAIKDAWSMSSEEFNAHKAKYGLF